MTSVLAKKTPIAPASAVQEAPAAPAAPEPKKKSILDSLFEEDRAELNKKTPIVAPSTTSTTTPVVKANPNSWLDEISSTTPKRPATAGALRTPDSTSPTRTAIKTPAETKNEFGIEKTLIKMNSSRLIEWTLIQISVSKIPFFPLKLLQRRTLHLA